MVVRDLQLLEDDGYLPWVGAGSWLLLATTLGEDVWRLAMAVEGNWFAHFDVGCYGLRKSVFSCIDSGESGFLYIPFHNLPET